MRLAFLAPLVLTASLLGQTEGMYQAPADLVLRQGVILTVNSTDSVAEAVAVRDGRIVAVGTDAGIACFIGGKTKVIDLAGRTVTPGLIDTHAHLLTSGTDEIVGVDLGRPPALPT